MTKVRPRTIALAIVAAGILFGAFFAASALLSIGPLRHDPLAHDREEHTATALLDGRVLVVGGAPISSFGFAWFSSRDALIYDAATRSIAGAANAPGSYSDHSALLLHDGRVMLIGSATAGYRRPAIFDPLNGRWTTTSDLAVHRTGRYRGTLLPDGSVLVVGGGDSSVPNRPGYWTAERYDVESDRWREIDPVDIDGRSVLGVATLSGGRALAVFGTQVRLFDPARGCWASAGSLIDDHLQALIPLSGDRLLAIVRTSDARFVGEAFDPTRDDWLVTAPFGTPGSSPASVSAVALADGRVLATGGRGPYGQVTFPGVPPANRPTTASFIFEPSTFRWSAAPAMRISRGGHTLTLLHSGNVLAAGGSPLTPGQGDLSMEEFDAGSRTWRDMSPRRQ